MTHSSTPTTTESRLARLKSILQEELKPGEFENLAAALISELLGISIAVAKSGFQHGGDAGPTGRQGRRFRIETKRYADRTSLSDRELLGEVDHAIYRDPALEAWFLMATRSVPEQIEQDLLRKSEELGLPIVVIDWKPNMFPTLAALCTSAPKALRAMISEEAGDLTQSLVHEGETALKALRRDLESWNLGFESLRELSLGQLSSIWNTPRASMAAFGQDAAGGHYAGTIRRDRSFADLSSWWDGGASKDAPATVIGGEGVGKTWAVLDWLVGRQEDLPIVLVIPSGTVAGITNFSAATIKEFVGRRFYELTEARDYMHWQKRFDRLLRRPFGEGPILTIFFDGMNQEPSGRWIDLIRLFQDSSFAGRVKLILTTRLFHFSDKLSSLRGLIEPPEVITVNIYDDSPGGELDQRLAAEGLTRNDLHDDLLLLARTPRLFFLVVRFRDRLVDTGQVTVHRLLWEYGRDSLGIRAGKSFSEDEWRSWLHEVAKKCRAGMRCYSLSGLGNMTARPDLTPEDVFRRLSDIVDSSFVTRKPGEQFELSPELVAHAFAIALLDDLGSLDNPDHNTVEQRLAQWFDPISGLDEKSEILRAAVSVQLELGGASPAIISGLVFEWLCSQNIPERHRSELARIASPLCDALLDVIERVGSGANKSAKLWAVNALRKVPRTETDILAKIVERATGWLHVVSRDVAPSNARQSDFDEARKKRFLMKIGIDADGKRTVLGQSLVFVERYNNTASATIPSLLEGFPLVSAESVFEAAALNMAIREQEDFWDGLKWLCLLNEIDFDATAKMLREKSDEYVALISEPGVHPELSHRVAALLLWLSGDEDNEVNAAKRNPSLGRIFSYKKDYLANPAKSLFKPERRHAEQILCDKSVPIHVRIDKTKHFFLDPNFTPPSDFSIELREHAAAFDVSKLDTNRSYTIEDHAFESLAPVLARCAPDLLAHLVRNKLKGFAMRPVGQRVASAAHAVRQLLLTNDDCVSSARILRQKHRDTDENIEAFIAAQLLILEVQGLIAVDQVIALIEADLKYISQDFVNVLNPLSNEDVDNLIRIYSSGSKKQISDLVLLLCYTATSLNEISWEWLISLSQDTEFPHRGAVFKLLNAANSQRFGQILVDAGWHWQPDEDVWCNHYGSLALIAATKDLPFEQHVSAIAPWLLLRALVSREETEGDAQLVAEVLDSILYDSSAEAPNLESLISVDCDDRKSDPSIYSITVRYDDGDDPLAALRTAMDAEKRLEIRRRSVETAKNRINGARSSGASLYLHNIDSADIEPIIRYAPEKITKWLEGANTNTSGFKYRVLLADGFHLALCETLLSTSPDQGLVLWRGLRKALTTKYLGKGRVEEMIHILFHSSNTLAQLREEQLSLALTNSDQNLFELTIAADMNGAREWLQQIIDADLASGVVWRKQRAGKITSFLSGNTLPVSDAWPEGPVDLPTSRKNKNAQWQHKEACARHWWNIYWQAVSDEEAYAAWVLFLETVDRRAYGWMTFDDGGLDQTNPTIQRRLAHFYSNGSALKSAMEKQEKEMEREFLGRKTVDGIGPWGKVDG